MSNKKAAEFTTAVVLLALSGAGFMVLYDYFSQPPVITIQCRDYKTDGSPAEVIILDKGASTAVVSFHVTGKPTLITSGPLEAQFSDRDVTFDWRRDPDMTDPILATQPMVFQHYVIDSITLEGSITTSTKSLWRALSEEDRKLDSARAQTISCVRSIKEF